MKARRRRQRGFTLIELMAVMAIMAILLSLGMMSFKSLSGSTGLDGAGDQLNGFFAFARQEAIAKNTMTAVIMVTNPTVSNGNASYRTFALWELTLPADGTAPESSNWNQASRWMTLPTGIVVDNSTTDGVSNFLQGPANSDSIQPPLPASLNYQGTPLNLDQDCVYQIFLPSGRLDAPMTDPCTLRLVEGFYKNSVITYQHLNSSTSQPANYVSYIFSTATGEPKIVRP